MFNHFFQRSPVSFETTLNQIPQRFIKFKKLLQQTPTQNNGCLKPIHPRTTCQFKPRIYCCQKKGYTVICTSWLRRRLCSKTGRVVANMAAIASLHNQESKSGIFRLRTHNNAAILDPTRQLYDSAIMCVFLRRSLSVSDSSVAIACI